MTHEEALKLLKQRLELLIQELETLKIAINAIEESVKLPHRPWSFDCELCQKMVIWLDPTTGNVTDKSHDCDSCDLEILCKDCFKSHKPNCAGRVQ